MSFFKFLDDSPGIRKIFAHNEARYDPIRRFKKDIMQGPSALSLGERELIAAFVSALNQCRFCASGHTANAASLGIDVGLLEGLLASVDAAAISDRLKPIFRFVKKLTEQPAQIVQADAEAVFAAGWDETALGDAIAICAYFNMVNRLVDGHGVKTQAKGRDTPAGCRAAPRAAPACLR